MTKHDFRDGVGRFAVENGKTAQLFKFYKTAEGRALWDLLVEARKSGKNTMKEVWRPNMPDFAKPWVRVVNGVEIDGGYDATVKMLRRAGVLAINDKKRKRTKNPPPILNITTLGPATQVSKLVTLEEIGSTRDKLQKYNMLAAQESDPIIKTNLRNTAEHLEDELDRQLNGYRAFARRETDQAVK